MYYQRAPLLSLSDPVAAPEAEKHPCTLPSGVAACRLIEGDAAAVPSVLGWTAVRAIAIAAGLYAVGARKHLVRNSVAASVAVEVLVLGHVALRRRAAQGP